MTIYINNQQELEALKDKNGNIMVIGDLTIGKKGRRTSLDLKNIGVLFATETLQADYVDFNNTVKVGCFFYGGHWNKSNSLFRKLHNKRHRETNTTCLIGSLLVIILGLLLFPLY